MTGLDFETWTAADGWKLEPAQLRARLEADGADEDTVGDCLILQADLRADPRLRPPSSNGSVPPAERKPPPDDGPAADLDAEEDVIGAMLLSPAAIELVTKTGLTADEFYYRESHGTIYQTIVALHDAGRPGHDVRVVIDALRSRGQLDRIGGKVRVAELAAKVPAWANAAHYARIVRKMAALRAIDQLGLDARRLAREQPGGIQELVDQIAAGLEAVIVHSPEDPDPPEAVGAGEFIFGDQATGLTCLWGNDDQIAWASGEGLMIVGPDGVGKTTLGQQVALARAGIRQAVLGMPLEPDERRVLYIAADRPRQALRSFARMVGPLQRDQLDERITVWRGALPFLLNEEPRALARLAERLHAGTIVIDSLKDVALDISKDEPGARVNYALQHVIAAGLELLVLHHQRKATSDNKRPSALADVYGSRWLTAGMGSVIVLWGDPGDPVVELRHIKQPVDEVGPWNVIHDHVRGLSTLDRPPDLRDLLHRAGADGVTVIHAASVLFSTDVPDRNQKEKARRRLDKLADTGHALRIPGVGSTPNGANPDRYVTTGPNQ